MKTSNKIKIFYKIHKGWIENLNYRFQVKRIQELHIFDSGYGILKEINPRYFGILREWKRVDYLLLDIDIMIQHMKSIEDQKKSEGLVVKINENSKMILELMEVILQKVEMAEQIQRQIKASNHQGKRA